MTARFVLEDNEHKELICSSIGLGGYIAIGAAVGGPVGGVVGACIYGGTRALGWIFGLFSK
jgi:hypothetical protein